MRAAVVIPWYPGTACPWRRRWLAVALRHWRGSDARLGPVLIGSGSEGAARNSGVAAARRDFGADVFLVADADSLIPLDRALAALELAAAAPGLVVAHDRYVFLGRASSDRLGADAAAALDADGRLPDDVIADAEWHGTTSVGGPVAFSAETFDLAGGYDARVVHGYDVCFALACAALAGPGSRLPGDMVSLWHPRPPAHEQDPPDTWATLRAYHDAAEAGPDAMRALVRSRAAG